MYYQIIDNKEIVQSPELIDAYGGNPITIDELNKLLSEKTAGTYKIPKTTLRWYHGIGLIDKPMKKGRFSIYPFETLWDLLAIHRLHDLYHLEIKKVLVLKRLKAPLYAITSVLQQLELEFIAHYAAPTLHRFLNRDSEAMYKADKIYPVRFEDKQVMLGEWNYLQVFRVIEEKRTFPSIRKDYFKLVRQKSNPVHISIQFDKK